MYKIIHEANSFLQEVQSVFPKKVHKLLEFGFKSLSLQRIVSLNSNARSMILNTHTAESKAYRLSKNPRFNKLFPRLLQSLNLIQEGDIIAIDFSDFNGMNVLMFAKQTKTGRTIPLFFDIITYPIEKGSQNTFIIKTIDEFLKIISPKKVKLVFDRGFAFPSLIKHLAKIKATFYIRIKGGKQVKYLNQSRKAKSFRKGKYKVNAYENKLSLTITPKPQNVKKNHEPWYIISNDMDSSQEQVQEIYYYRFEIEELFKDAKRIFNLEHIKFKIPHNLKTTLWFVILGIWFHYFLEENIGEAKIEIKKCKDSFNQSITHYWMEKINLYLKLSALKQICIKYG